VLKVGSWDIVVELMICCGKGLKMMSGVGCETGEDEFLILQVKVV
jgi:hypothetical protein